MHINDIETSDHYIISSAYAPTMTKQDEVKERVSSWMENPYGKSIWIFFFENPFFLNLF